MAFKPLAPADNVLASSDYMVMARNELQYALKHASPVESMLILQLLQNLAQIQNQASCLGGAMRPERG